MEDNERDVGAGIVRSNSRATEIDGKLRGTQRACKCGGVGDDIGDDATGRRYFWCASCGREWTAEP